MPRHVGLERAIPPLNACGLSSVKMTTKPNACIPRQGGGVVRRADVFAVGYTADVRRQGARGTRGEVYVGGTIIHIPRAHRVIVPYI